MSTSSTRRRSGRQHAVEHEALSEIASEAEARLAAKRAARAEAREIRMREIERQQLEDQEKERLNRNEHKKDFTHVPSYTSRRESNGNTDDLKKELSELQEKYVRTMTHNAQLDNDKQTLTFRVALLTEDLDDMLETNTELRRQLKDKTRDFEHKKKAHELLEATVSKLQEQLEQRDLLIQEHGLIFISDDVSEDEDDVDGPEERKKEKKKCALVSQRALDVLENFSGTLDDRLIKLDEEKKALEKLVKKLKRNLDEERERRSVTDRFKSHSPTPNRFNNGGGSGEGGHEVDLNTHAELKRQLKDYKLKVNKAHQEVATLEGTVARLEAQVKRYKTTAESSERSEEELRNEKRKLQKELREAENARSELEVERNHLLKRLERSKGLKNK